MSTDSIDSYIEPEVFSGVSRVCSAIGIDPVQVIVKKAANDMIDNSLEMQQLYSRAGAKLLELAGMAGSENHRILCKCASSDRLLSEEVHNAFINPVKDTMQKMAGKGGTILSGLASAATNAPYLAAVIATVAGGLGGAGIYALQRAMEQGDAEVEAKYQQAKQFRDAARQLQEKLEKGKASVRNAPSGLFV